MHMMLIDPTESHDVRGPMDACQMTIVGLYDIKKTINSHFAKMTIVRSHVVGRPMDLGQNVVNDVIGLIDAHGVKRS